MRLRLASSLPREAGKSSLPAGSKGTSAEAAQGYVLCSLETEFIFHAYGSLQRKVYSPGRHYIRESRPFPDRLGLNDRLHDGVVLHKSRVFSFSANGGVVYGHLHFLYNENTCLLITVLRLAQHRALKNNMGQHHRSHTETDRSLLLVA